MLLFVLSGFGVKKVAENPDLPKWNGYANTTSIIFYANLFTIESRRVVPACNARLGVIARTRNIDVLTY